MSIQKLLELRPVFLMGMAISVSIYAFTRSTLCMMVFYLLVAVWLVLTALFWKCPHCGKFLGRSRGVYCHHCGKKLVE